MTSSAILIGNASYLHEQDLDCCRNDVAVMQELIEATGRFDSIHACCDLDADAMRDLVRSALPTEDEQHEVFFYFSGHGAHLDGEFYYCGTKFDGRRPNETGVSHSELHGLFRAGCPTNLVVVIDACYSGTLLVKRETQPPPLVKEGFQNVFQFSSSMNNQTSLGGEPLSDYTRAFVEASIRKPEGAVYYTDISNALRDTFIHNDGQTPFFVYQGTGREIFIDDATKLNGFRKCFATRLDGPEGQVEAAEGSDASIRSNGDSTVAEPPSVTQLLAAAEDKMGSPKEAKELIDQLFDGLAKNIQSAEFAEYFETSIVEHSRYYEPAIEEFMIRVLSREKRPDKLVSAEVKRNRQNQNPLAALSAGLSLAMGQNVAEHFILELNCSLERAQLRMTLTPKYKTLQQLILVLSCAPSLEQCYVFELVTRHPRTDWDEFDSEGEEVVKRWYTLKWGGATAWLVEKICDGLATAVKNHIDETTKRLSEQ